MSEPVQPSSVVDDRPTRRAILHRFGSVGVAATAGAGLLGLLGAQGADAATRRAAGAKMTTVSFVPSVMPECACQETCTISEYSCDGGNACPAGQCCYHCTGCGTNYYTCGPHKCNVTSYNKCS